MKEIIFLLTFLTSYYLQSQTDSEIAFSNAKKAIELMDDGNIEESITLLKESQRLDPNNFIYPYEIAYAKILQEKFSEAIVILERVKSYDSINSQVYQALGNSYSYLGQPDKAIEKYNEGLKKFPNAGNLYLEKGNIFNQQSKYNDAIKNYETGVRVDPMFPSNYYHLSSLYLNSNDKLSGLIYGEIFMNIERTTERTREVSEWLFNTYSESIVLGDEESEIDFCDIIIDANHALKGDIELPFCLIFGKNIMLSLIGKKEINLNTLSEIRIDFLNNYFIEDHENYPNVLFSYQKRLLENNLFDSYNHYLFQIAVPEQFNDWLKSHESEFNDFVNWYLKPENIIEISEDNVFIK